MKRKILVLFMLLCVITSSTGCFNQKSQTNVSSFHTKNTKNDQYSLSNEKTDLTQVKFGVKDEAVLATGTLPSNLRVVGNPWELKLKIYTNRNTYVIG